MDFYENALDVHESAEIFRKYFNEARYPYGDASVYTDEFALDFLKNLTDVKNFIDNECVASVEDLKNKFK